MMPYLAATAAVAALLALAAAGWLHTRRPARPQDPGWGSYEGWSPLGTIGAQATSHDLDPPYDPVATHVDLAAIGDALTQFGRAIDNALWEFVQPLDAATLGRLLAAREATGELDRAALEALLVEGREVACRA